MSSPRTSLLAVAALAGAALTFTAAADAALTTLAVEQVPTRVAAWEGTVMWSRLDPATGRYALLQSVGGGAPAPVAVAQRAGGPFDIDLGTDRQGAMAAVYTRDGDVYRLSVPTGIEQKLDRISSPTLAERDPTIHRGYIAFIRRDHGLDVLRIGRTTGSSDGSRVIVTKRSIVSAELGKDHVAYVEAVPQGRHGARNVHVRNVHNGRDAIVYRATSGGANTARVTKPTYVAAPEAFVWARTNNNSAVGNRLVRYRLRGAKLTYAKGGRHYVSTAWAGGALGVATSSARAAGQTADACVDVRNFCVVQLTGPPSFTLGP
jgi:hypothetical protein